MKDKVDKICQICGELGIGRHFGAITCESCKAFFRRNALKKKVLECPSEGKCRINLNTRKLCQNCRLNKCFEMGMKKEFIRSAEERESRRRLIEENRRKRNQLKESNDNNNSCDDYVSQTESSNPPSNATTIPVDNDEDEDCVDTESLSDIIDGVLDMSDEELTEQITEIEGFIANSLVDRRLECADQRSRQMAVIPLCKGLVDYKGFNDLETIRIAELMSASQIFNYPSSKNLIKILDKHKLLTIHGQRTEESIKEVMAYTKSLSPFTTVCPEDQYTLFKAGVGEMQMIRCVMYYDHERKSFTVYIDNETSIVVSFNMFESDFAQYFLLYQELFGEFISKILPAWNKDPVIMELLNAIVLFNPNRPNLKHRHNIKLEQQLYIYLLQRYLLLKCQSEGESEEKLCKLMNTLTDVYKIIEFNKMVGIGDFKQYEQYFGPLVKELYDIT